MAFISVDSRAATGRLKRSSCLSSPPCGQAKSTPAVTPVALKHPPFMPSDNEWNGASAPEWFVNLSDQEREVLMLCARQIATYRAQRKANRLAEQMPLHMLSAEILTFPQM